MVFVSVTLVSVRIGPGAGIVARLSRSRREGDDSVEDMPDSLSVPSGTQRGARWFTNGVVLWLEKGTFDVLREVQELDIEIFFKHQLDPVSSWQVSFTHKDPTDEKAFNVHIVDALRNETVVMRIIVIDSEVAGYITKYDIEEEPQIGFVLGREFWGKGIATESLREFLSIFTKRLVYARTAFDNEASMRVLQKLGFKRTSKENCFSNARGIEIVEVLWTLE